MADVFQNGNDNLAKISKTTGIAKLLKNRVGDHNATIWQDEVSVPSATLFGDDDATQTNGGDNKTTTDQGTSEIIQFLHR
jgi:hypothetical protein